MERDRVGGRLRRGAPRIEVGGRSQPCPAPDCPPGFPKDPKELEDGFPSKAEDLFKFQGLMIDNVEAVKPSLEGEKKPPKQVRSRISKAKA